MARLFSARGVLPPAKRLFWYGQHLQKFLRWCRGQPGDGNLPDLRAGYLRELESSEAATPQWQMDQVRIALDALEQGVDNWHLERDERGVWEPRFRLKTGPTGQNGTNQAEEGGLESATPSLLHGTRCSSASERMAAEDAAPLKPGEHWRERMRRVLRLRHYAWRTETSYTEWVARFME